MFLVKGLKFGVQPLAERGTRRETARKLRAPNRGGWGSALRLCTFLAFLPLVDPPCPGHWPLPPASLHPSLPTPSPVCWAFPSFFGFWGATWFCHAGAFPGWHLCTCFENALSLFTLVYAWAGCCSPVVVRRDGVSRSLRPLLGVSFRCGRGLGSPTEEQTE